MYTLFTPTDGHPCASGCVGHVRRGRSLPHIRVMQGRSLSHIYVSEGQTS